MAKPRVWKFTINFFAVFLAVATFASDNSTCNKESNEVFETDLIQAIKSQSPKTYKLRKNRNLFLNWITTGQSKFAVKVKEELDCLFQISANQTKSDQNPQRSKQKKTKWELEIDQIEVGCAIAEQELKPPLGQCQLILQFGLLEHPSRNKRFEEAITIKKKPDRLSPVGRK